MTKNTVSIIVVTYNRIEYLKSFIEFLYLSTEYPFELIVVDNGSTDGSREFIAREELVSKCVFNKKNLPLAAAFTEGFIVSEGEYIVTVADDMIPPLFKKPDWLEVFVAKMNSDENIGCINFVGARRNFNEFNRKERQKIYDKR